MGYTSSSKLNYLLTISLVLLSLSCGKKVSGIETPSENSEKSEQQLDIQSAYGKSVSTHQNFPVNATQRAYRGILQREADSGGLQSFSELLRTGGTQAWPEFLNILLNSEEFKTQIEAKQSGRQILDSLYEGFLGPNRVVDPDGARGYLQMIRQGKLKEVVMIIAMSDEFFNKVLGLPHPDGRQSTVAIQRVYRALLNREASEVELTEAFTPVSQTGIRGLHDLIDKITASQEYKAHIENTLTSAQLVAQVYQGLLLRLPTSNESAQFDTRKSRFGVSNATHHVLLNSEFFSGL